MYGFVMDEEGFARVVKFVKQYLPKDKIEEFRDLLIAVKIDKTFYPEELVKAQFQEILQAISDAHKIDSGDELGNIF